MVPSFQVIHNKEVHFAETGEQRVALYMDLREPIHYRLCPQNKYEFIFLAKSLIGESYTIITRA